MKVVLIRYSEIHLKGNNRSYFENALANNIRQNLKPMNFSLTKSSSRFCISNFDQSLVEEIVDKVKNTFGVCSVSVAEVVDSNLDKITEVVDGFFDDEKQKTFKISTNRADKTFPLNSVQISMEIGGRMLDNHSNLTVDLHNPQIVVYIDVRENGKTYVFSEIQTGVSGLPVGTSGKGMVLLSGGIDSPVACYMMAKRGMSLRAVHFHSFPFTSMQAKDKVIDLAKIVNKYCMNMVVEVVNFREIQTQIHENCPEQFMITILRRFMMRAAEILAKRHNCGAIVTGESLGQVASQTLESLTSTNSVATIPVLRPLIGFNKEEIITLAKQIDTFNTSIQPFEDCCTVFLPKNPAIKPQLALVEKLEQRLDVEGLLARALEDIETVTLS